MATCGLSALFFQVHQVLHSVLQKDTFYFSVCKVSVTPGILRVFALPRMTQIDEFEARQKEAKEARMARWLPEVRWFHLLWCNDVTWRYDAVTCVVCIKLVGVPSIWTICGIRRAWSCPRNQSGGIEGTLRERAATTDTGPGGDQFTAFGHVVFSQRRWASNTTKPYNTGPQMSTVYQCISLFYGNSKRGNYHQLARNVRYSIVFPVFPTCSDPQTKRGCQVGGMGGIP